MKQLTVTINGKGGVGKSLFTVQFLSFLEEKEVPHVAIDTDNENSTLSRFYPKSEFVDLENRPEIDTIFNRLEANELVVVDARAASTDIFVSYFKELQIFEILKQLDTRLTLACPINNDADSLEQVRSLVEEFGSHASYVIVKNQSHSDEFNLWDESKTRGKVKDLGGQEMIMPRIYDWLVTGLNQQGLTVNRAIEGKAFSVLDTQRLKNWQARFRTELETVLYLLT